MNGCPSPDTLAFWQSVMTLVGATLLGCALWGAGMLLLGAGVGGWRRGRLPPWLLTLAVGALGGWALALAARLHAAFGEIAVYFAYYPYQCTPNAHGPPAYYVTVYTLANQIALPREQAARVTLTLAVALALLQVGAVLLWAWRNRRAAPTR